MNVLDKVYNLTVDIKNIDTKYNSYAKFFDDDRETSVIKVKILNNNSPIDLENCSVEAYFVLANNTYHNETCKIIDSSEGIVELQLCQKCLVKGENIVRLSILKDNEIANTPIITYEVRKGLYSDNPNFNDDPLTPILSQMLLDVKVTKVNQIELQERYEKSLPKIEGKIKEVESLINRVDTAIASGTQDLEVKEARVDKNGKSYAKLGDRLNEVDSQLAHIEKSKSNVVDLEVERKRIDLLSKVENGETEGNTELLDIRIGLNGVEYKTAGDSVRKQLLTVNNKFDNIYNNALTQIDINNCSWSRSTCYNGVLNNDSKTLTSDLIFMKKNTVINVLDPNIYQKRVTIYDLKTKEYISNKGYDTEDYILNDDYYVRVSLSRIDDVAMHNNEISKAISLIGYINCNNVKLENIDTSNVNILTFDKFEQGTITDGYNVNSTTRIRTIEKILLPKGSVIRNKLNLMYYYSVSAYNSHNMEFIEEITNGWQVDTERFVIPYDCYIRVLIRKKDNKYIENIDIDKVFEIYTPEKITYNRLDDNVKNEINNVKNKINNNCFIEEENSTIKIMSHRGWMDDCPENTIIALKKAKENGFRIVEFDVRMTRDNIPVVLHDSTLNRTARKEDGSTLTDVIEINNITYQEALEYDYGLYIGNEYKGTTINTLEELLLYCKYNNMIASIETKTYNNDDVTTMFNCVNKHGMKNKVQWVASSRLIAEHILSLHGKAKIGIGTIVSNITDAEMTYVKGLQTKYPMCELWFDVAYNEDFTQEIADLIHSYGFDFTCYVYNSIANAKKSIELGAMGITSNNIHLYQIVEGMYN